MARSNDPPLPTAVRPLFWVIRVFGALIGVGVLYVAALAANQQRWDLFGLVLVVGGGFVALTWIPPTSRWFLPIFAFVGLAVAIPLRSWTVVFVVVGTIGLMVWMRRRPLGGLGMVNPDKIVAVAPDSVMKNARAFVEEFRAAGFEQVGAIQFSLGPIKVIESLMIAPDARSYAAVTDAVINVSSVYPGGRGLVTRNSARTPLPDYLLADTVPGGRPAELIESHARAVAAVADRGHHSIPVAAPELPQIAIDNERAALAWAAANRDRKPGDADIGPLWSQPDLDALIIAWHGGTDASS